MAVAVPPRMLSAEWPTMIGKRVSFVSRIERNLGRRQGGVRRHDVAGQRLGKQ